MGKGSQTRTFCYITDAIVGLCKVIIDGKEWRGIQYW